LPIISHATGAVGALGINGEWKFRDGWSVGAEVAWLPYNVVNANDTHWLRPFSAPEKGTNLSTIQIEALLGYKFLNGFFVGAGGRYWRLDNTFATETKSTVGIPQAISLHTERWGGFFQASYKFGQLQPSPL
jgi:hypothetical protein